MKNRHSDIPDSNDSPQTHRCGYVGIVGLPNAGKSTLFNRLLGQKLAIITPKEQTTRHRIPGFYSDETCQIIFLDTPGIIRPSYLLQEKMMDQVYSLRKDADLLIHLVDGRYPPGPDDPVWDTLKELHLPTLLVVNKMDLLSKEEIEKTIESCLEKGNYFDSLALSAREGKGIEALADTLKKMLPPGPALYPKEDASTLSLKFFISELIREQLFMLYQQEIPYSCSVNIVDYKEEEKIDKIRAEIVVNRASQKAIIIGKKGAMVKKLGIRSRASIESFLEKNVYLDLFVKVREKWRDKELFLKNYGYNQ